MIRTHQGMQRLSYCKASVSIVAYMISTIGRRGQTAPWTSHLYCERKQQQVLTFLFVMALIEHVFHTRTGDENELTRENINLKPDEVVVHHFIIKARKKSSSVPSN
jgi:hypothetical protein